MDLNNVVAELEKITVNTNEIKELKNLILTVQNNNNDVFLFFSICFIIIICVLIVGWVSNAVN